MLRSSRSKNENGGSSIFGVEDRRSKMGEVLRSSGSENHRWGSSISGSEDRRTSPYLRSSEPMIEESPIFDLRSSAPMIEGRPSIFDLRPRRTGRKSDRRGGGAISSKMGRVLRRWGGSSIFRARRTKNPPIFDLRGRKNGESPIFHFLNPKTEEPPTFFFFRPPRPMATSSSQLS